LWLHEYFSKLYIRKGIRRDPEGPETPPPEWPEDPEASAGRPGGPETFAKRPGGPAIPSPEGKEVSHDQKFA